MNKKIKIIIATVLFLLLVFVGFFIITTRMSEPTKELIANNDHPISNVGPSDKVTVLISGDDNIYCYKGNDIAAGEQILFCQHPIV